MWKQLWTVGIGVIVTVVAASAQGTSPSGPAAWVVIGCLESAQNSFMLMDYRSNTRYRLEATAEMLGWHVGHELEIHGTLQSGGQTPTLKVDTVIYISQTCSQGSGKGD